MPHTPTERSFDINFLRCGGKTKRRREAHELCSGLSFTTIGLLPFVVLNRSTLMKNANTHAHSNTHTQTVHVELMLKNVPHTDTKKAKFSPANFH